MPDQYAATPGNRNTQNSHQDVIYNMCSRVLQLALRYFLSIHARTPTWPTTLISPSGWTAKSTYTGQHMRSERVHGHHSDLGKCEISLFPVPMKDSIVCMVVWSPESTRTRTHPKNLYYQKMSPIGAGGGTWSPAHALRTSPLLSSLTLLIIPCAWDPRWEFLGCRTMPGPVPARTARPQECNKWFEK